MKQVLQLPPWVYMLGFVMFQVSGSLLLRVASQRTGPAAVGLFFLGNAVGFCGAGHVALHAFVGLMQQLRANLQLLLIAHGVEYPVVSARTDDADIDLGDDDGWARFHVDVVDPVVAGTSAITGETDQEAGFRVNSSVRHHAQHSGRHAQEKGRPNGGQKSTQQHTFIPLPPPPSPWRQSRKYLRV